MTNHNDLIALAMRQSAGPDGRFQATDFWIALQRFSALPRSTSIGKDESSLVAVILSGRDDVRRLNDTTYEIVATGSPEAASAS